jgi:hypothetical protein
MEDCLPDAESPKLPLTPAASTPSQFVSTQRFANQPEHWRPQADEQSSAFRVSPFVLADGLGTDPEDDAEQDGPD